jgi:starvation-inducible outer membrane lipoprotein
MKAKPVVTTLIIILLSLSLGGCSLFANNPVNIPGTDQTSIAQTVVVLQTQLAVQPTTSLFFLLQRLNLLPL